MVTRIVKTTIELPDSLLDEAKRAARARGTTLRALIEAGLRGVLAEERKHRRFRLADASVGGRGLRAELRGDDWSAVRDEIYRGRGA